MQDSSPDTAAIMPMDAASLIILDQSRATPRVLMGKRHMRHVFMPGAIVFPGGRLEDCDSDMPVAGALHPAAEHKLMLHVEEPSPLLARALALAAIRETFEETGHLIGTTDYGAPEGVPALWSAFAQHGVFPELDSLHFLARAITPPAFPRRYDTRFFVVDAEHIVHTVDGACGPDEEFVGLTWLPLEETLDQDIPYITRVILAELSRCITSGFRQEAPVPLFREEYGEDMRLEL